MGRFVWFAIGAGATVFAVLKAREAMTRAAPKAIGQRVSDSTTGLGARAQDFADRVRAASAEREAELRAELNLPAAGSDRLGLND